MKDRFTSVTFKNYKALKRYSVSLNEFNVLVGPNNAGKSTIVGVFRILSEGIRKAASRKPQYIDIEGIDTFGYSIPLKELPVATENIFTNYDESEHAIVEFGLSTGNKLKLVFPEKNVCYLIPVQKGKQVQSPSDFRRVYNASVGIVPILGPVEHNEQLFQKEAARSALLSHRASRNFRNIWYHYPDDFDEFRKLIGATWPGMDIECPEVDTSHEKPVLHMFCPEERYPREIFWAGFGFQVWCQMLTYIVRSKDDSLLIIDEPDIYLHSDLQRQLVEILRQSEPDVLIATHSTEIISEAEPGDLLVINKKNRSARRIKHPAQLQNIFGALGSNLNPTLTQLAKSRRAVFVEGKDFQILSSLSRKLDRQAIANRSDFAVIPVEGFNPAKVRDFSEGIEATLGTKILKGVIFDRDYRSDDEVKKLKKDFDKFCEFFHIHERKEIENYLLIPSVLKKAIQKRVKDRSTRINKTITFKEDVEQILTELTQQLKSQVMSQFLTKRGASSKTAEPNLDIVTINQRLLDEFEDVWSDLQNRLIIVPGKKLLAKLNDYLQEMYGITLSHSGILASMKATDIPGELVNLIEKLEVFRNSEP